MEMAYRNQCPNLGLICKNRLIQHSNKTILEV